MRGTKRHVQGLMVGQFVLLAWFGACAPKPGVSTAQAPSPSASSSSSDDSVALVEEEQSTEELIEKAKKAASERKLNRAWKLAQLVWERAPTRYVDAPVILGDICVEREHYEEALEWYEKARQIAPSEGWIVVRIAQVLGKQNNKREARKALERFRDTTTRLSVEACEALGWLCLNDGDYKAAEDAFGCAVTASGRTSVEGYYGLAVLAAVRHDAATVSQALSSLLYLAPERIEQVKADDALADMRDDPRVKEVLERSTTRDAGSPDASK